LFTIDCHELTVDEQLALASALSEGLEGKALALVRDIDIVFDTLGAKGIDEVQVEAMVRRFVAKRKDGKYYSVEREGDSLVVRSADPLARSRGRKNPGLPANLLKCPACSYVTEYQEALTVHLRSHYAGLTG
jgi:hypothetical protein